MLSTKWYSSNCFVKFYSNSDGGREKGLTCLKNLDKNELVATFSCEQTISPEMHFIRQNDMPTCYLEKTQVFTKFKLEPLKELTLNYNLK